MSFLVMMRKREAKSRDWSQPYRDALFGEIFFNIAHSVGAEVEDAGGEDGIGVAFEKDFGHVFEGAGAAAGDDGDADGFADAAGDDEVEAFFGAVGVDGVEHDFAGAKGRGFFGPFNGVEAGVFAAAVGEDAPFVRGDLFGINGDDDALAAEFFGALADQFRIGEGAGIDADLVRAGTEHGKHVIHGFDAAADSEGHKTLIGRAFDDIHHGATTVGGGGDIEENHFIGPLLIVAEGEFHRVADIAEAAFFGHAELDTAGDLAVVNVQAGNDTFCDHTHIKRLSALGLKMKLED